MSAPHIQAMPTARSFEKVGRLEKIGNSSRGQRTDMER